MLIYSNKKMVESVLSISPSATQFSNGLFNAVAKKLNFWSCNFNEQQIQNNNIDNNLSQIII